MLTYAMTLQLHRIKISHKFCLVELMNFVINPVLFLFVDPPPPPPTHTGRGLCECRVKAMGLTGLKKHIITGGISLCG